MHVTNNPSAIVIGSLGDSLTVGPVFNHIFNLDTASWVDSEHLETNSYLQRVRDCQKNKTTVYIVNQAKIGARVADLAYQARQLNSKLPRHVFYRLVTITIGTNDICKSGLELIASLDRFHQDLVSALEELLRKNSQVKIALLPLPDLTALVEMTDNQACRSKRWFLGNCSFLNDIDLENQRQLTDLIAAINLLFRKLKDEYPDNLIFLDSLLRVPFEKKHILSFDCFHPSKEGHSLIAKKTWDDVKQYLCP